MSEVHPAFSDQTDPLKGELLSEPFIAPEKYVLLGEFDTLPIPNMVPHAIGVTAVREGAFQFTSGLSRESTTPFNHSSQYLEEYKARVEPAHEPVFAGHTDRSADSKVVSAVQGSVAKEAQEDGQRVVSAFVLGLINGKMPVAGLIVNRKALDSIENVVDMVYENIMISSPGYLDKVAAESKTEGKVSAERLAETAKYLLSFNGFGRLLPTPSKAKENFVSASPELREFFAKPKKAQKKILKAERRFALSYN